jgi:hypothetical protein
MLSTNKIVLERHSTEEEKKIFVVSYLRSDYSLLASFIETLNISSFLFMVSNMIRLVDDVFQCKYFSG